MENYGMTNPNIANLDELTPEQLRELADQKEKIATVAPIAFGLRVLADLVERTPETKWADKKAGIDFYYNTYSDSEKPVAWAASLIAKFGGEWERWGAETGYFIARRHFGPFHIDVNVNLEELTGDEVATLEAAVLATRPAPDLAVVSDDRLAAQDDPRGERDS